MKLLYQAEYNLTGAKVKFYDINLVEISYDRSTYSDQENNEETAWTKQQLDILLKKFPQAKLYVLFDFTNIQDVEMTTDSSMYDYAKMLKNEKIIRVATYGQTVSFKILINIISTISKTARKVKVCNNRVEAIEWLGI